MEDVITKRFEHLFAFAVKHSPTNREAEGILHGPIQPKKKNRIIKHPGRFGLTRTHIEGAYREFGERIGTEARSWEELVKEVSGTGGSESEDT